MNRAEAALYAQLTDVDSLDVLAAEQFYSPERLEAVPTDVGKKLVKWSLDYYYQSGRRQAPSREAVQQTWGDELEMASIDLGDGTETDTIEWAIETLLANHGVWQSQQLTKQSAGAIAGADPNEKASAIRDVASEWSRLANSLQSRRKSQDAFQGLEDAFARWESRRDSGLSTDGLTFGLPQLDNHLHGVHPGEVCAWAAETGVGKSWMIGRTAYKEMRAGNRFVLFTLENDLPMTFDRVICMAARIDYEKFQIGELNEQESERFVSFIEECFASEKRFHVIMPPRGERSVDQMVRKALSLEADSMGIDQLTFIEPSERRQKRSDEIYQIMHDLKELVSEGTEKLPVMLMHQINREGAQHARKHGVYLPEHMSYGSEVERTVDFLFAIYQSEMDKRVEEAEFQLIKSRRTTKARWSAAFRVGLGDIRIRHRIIDDESHQGEAHGEPAPQPQPA